jgi:hypothetical protein
MPSATPSPTPEPTATPDTRVVDANPEDMIIAREDLPKDGMFILAYAKPYRNAESAASWGIEKGSKYIAESGRVDGWHAEYDRTVRTARAPEYIYIATILFETAAGPIYSTETLTKPCVTDDNKTTMVDPDIHLADKAYLCLWKKMQPNGEYYLEYEANIIYRNTLAVVYAGGSEDTFDVQTVLDLAKLQADKLATMPLAEIVTWKP